MIHLQDVVFFILAVITYIENTESDFVQLDAFGNTVPIVACEGSQQVYAVACLTMRSGGKPSRWIGWTSDGRVINIDYDSDKFSTATDGGHHFYLLISGSELSLDNNGEKYACYDPQDPPDQQHLHVLEEYAAVLHIIPNDRCVEEQTTTSFPPTSSHHMTSLLEELTTPTKDQIKTFQAPTDGNNTPSSASTSHFVYQDEEGDMNSQKNRQDSVEIYKRLVADARSLVQFVYVMVSVVCLLLVVHLLVLFRMCRFWTRMSRRDKCTPHQTPEIVCMMSSPDNTA